MKKIITTLLLLSLMITGHAQQLWQPLPMNFAVNSGEQEWFPFATYIEEDSTMYLSGNFTHINNVACNVVRVFDTGGYDLMPVNPYHSIRCMTRYNGKLYAGGDGLSYWNGSNWILMDSSENTMVTSLMPFEGKLLVTGVLGDITGNDCWKIAAWNDTAWADVHNVNSLFTDCDFDAVHTVTTYQNQLYLGGIFYKLTSSGDTLQNMMRYDGTQWTSVGSMHVIYESWIKKLLVWRDTLYASGQFTEALGGPGNGIAKWDGSHWSRLGAGLYMEHGSVEDLLVFNDELYACGWFQQVNGFMPPGQTLENVIGYAKWDGQKWCTMGTVPDNIILRMGRTKNDLYIIGGFEHLNNNPRHNIAKWIGGDFTDTCTIALEPTNISTPEEDILAPQMYPNPSTGKFTVQLATMPAKPLQLTMCSVTGAVMYKTDLVRQRQTIDPGKLSAGLYFVKISSGGQVYPFKILIR